MAKTDEKKGRSRANGEGGLLRVAGSRFWYAQYYQDGRQIRVSTRTDNKQEALATLRKLMGDRDNGLAPVTDMRRLRYADLRQALIDSYVAQGNKSLKSKADGSESIAGLTALDDFFGFKSEMSDGKQVVTERGVSVAQITTDAARRFVRKRRGDGTGNAAINRSLAALRRMLKIAKRDKKIHDVPYIEFQKEPSARKGFLERSDFDRLIKVLPTHLRPLVTFLYWCGCRIGETLQIEWSQVNLDLRQIQLEPEQTKTDEARVLPLPSVLVDMLRESEPTDGDAGRRVFDGTNLRKEWMKACAACGLGETTEVEGRPYDPIYSGLTLHDLRRSAVRNLRKAGVSEREAMKISGHKTRSVFDRYNIVSTEDVMDAMRKVEVAALNDSRKPVQSAKTSDAARTLAGDSLVKVGRRNTRKSLMALSSRG
ncbi:MAG TPA: site-specific integrase [Candidatus Sulfotelmatobacter sp.]|nr:site-specific integrase [Candidatus Sulfotelmatobacter sp.]